VLLSFLAKFRSILQVIAGIGVAHTSCMELSVSAEVFAGVEFAEPVEILNSLRINV
jgi:hypothetical protein